MAFLDNPLYAAAEIACRVLEEVYEAHGRGDLTDYMDENESEVLQAMLDLTSELVALEVGRQHVERCIYCLDTGRTVYMSGDTPRECPAGCDAHERRVGG